MTYFIFCVHNHQPVGNFDHVVEDAYVTAYEPFLKMLHERPSLKLSFHTSGFLLDWLVEHHPEYLEMLKSMVERGQVEIMGGGYYEPILAVIPPRDRRGQILMMSERIERLFGTRPRGVWLAERVWDPTLPFCLRDAGIEYVVVDDFHFIKSGLKRDELFGYYVTEDLGRAVKVFPGSERLRYLIPFEPVERLAEYLEGVDRNGSKDGVAIFADDGEKFGIWPGTDKWVYDEGWLESFLSKIEELGDWLKPVTFSEYADCVEPLGRVYLPTTSYMEMGEWALPAEASFEYLTLREDIKSWKDGEGILRFFQGGTWRNFLSKYPEADWMHKRMLMVSERLASAEPRVDEEGYRVLEDARTHLYRAQCNDAYWHGVFGGLYLPHLRTRVYENLLRAEGLIGACDEKVCIRAVDMDADMHDEVIMSTDLINLFFSPRRGGSLVEIDWKPGAVNLSNTLSRWFEGYHMRLEKAGTAGSAGEARSIHDTVLVKEQGLERYLRFDTVRRASLRELFVGEDAGVEDHSASRFRDLGDFYDGAYDFAIEGDRLRFERSGTLCEQPFSVAKEVGFAGRDSFSVRYTLEGLGKDAPRHVAGIRLGVEFNLCLPGCEGPECRYEFTGTSVVKETGLGSIGELSDIAKVSMVDGFSSLRITFAVDRPVVLWRYPIETVSLSEAGFERNYQGSSLVFLIPVDTLLSGAGGFTLSVKIESV